MLAKWIPPASVQGWVAHGSVLSCLVALVCLAVASRIQHAGERAADRALDRALENLVRDSPKDHPGQSQ